MTLRDSDLTSPEMDVFMALPIYGNPLNTISKKAIIYMCVCVCVYYTFSPSICHKVMGIDAMT